MRAEAETERKRRKHTDAMGFREPLVLLIGAELVGDPDQLLAHRAAGARTAPEDRGERRERPVVGKRLRGRGARGQRLAGANQRGTDGAAEVCTRRLQRRSGRRSRIETRGDELCLEGVDAARLRALRLLHEAAQRLPGDGEHQWTGDETGRPAEQKRGGPRRDCARPRRRRRTPITTGFSGVAPAAGCASNA